MGQQPEQLIDTIRRALTKCDSLTFLDPDWSDDFIGVVMKKGYGFPGDREEYSQSILISRKTAEMYVPGQDAFFSIEIEKFLKTFLNGLDLEMSLCPKCGKIPDDDSCPAP